MRRTVTVHFISKKIFLADELIVPVHGIALQVLVFINILNNCGGFSVSIVLYVVIVLLEYLTDYSIRVPQSCIILCVGCVPL